MPPPAGDNAQKGERNPVTKIFREFNGINTKNDRTAIPAETFYDLVNLMPIGASNLHSVPSPTALVSFSSTIYRFQYANINNTDYLICFGTDGTVSAYNIATNTLTANINSGYTLSGSASKMDQWKNQAVLVVDTNGYFSWNGSTWNAITGGILPGSYVNPDIAVYNNYVWIYSNRFLYISNPNQYSASTGTPLSTTGTWSSGSTTITVNQAASALGNIVVGSTVTGTGIATGTTVTSVNLTTGVIGLSAATTNSSPAQYATTATFGTGENVLVVGSATGIQAGSFITSTAQSANLPPNAQVASTYITGSTTVPITGQTTGTNKSGSVYVFSNYQTITFSTVDSGWDLAGGSLVQNLTDPQIRGQVTRLLSANGYLYLFSKSSVFVISDVYIPNGAVPPSPVFSIVNVQALIGTDQQMSVFALDRRMYFSNPYGLWGLEGVTAKRVSEPIDGTTQYLDPSWTVSGGTVEVWSIAQSAFLIKQLNDPVFGTRIILACLFDSKWWFYQPPTGCTFVGSGMAGTNNNVPSLFALINNQLYRLFANYSASPATSYKTALWSMDNSLADKEVFRAGFEVSAPSGIGSTFTLTLDTPNQSTNLNPTTGTQNIAWVNSSSNTVLWTNNSSATISWYNATYALYFADGLGGYGKYVGMTFTSTAGSPFSITSVSMDFTYRKRW